MTAATITGSETATGYPTRSNIGETILYGEFSLADDNASGALEADDILQVVKVPSGFRVLEVILSTTDLDTNGTPTITFDVGDGGDVDRYIDGTTAPQAGGIARLDSIAGAGYRYTEADTIDVKVASAVATGATTGTVKLTVIGTMN